MRASHLFLTELVVFLNGLFDAPLAVEASGEYDEIARCELRDAFGCFDFRFAFEEVAGFLRVVMPVEIGRVFCPYRPQENAEFFEVFVKGTADLNLQC